MSIFYPFEVETHLDIRQALSQMLEFLGIEPVLKPVGGGSPAIYGNGPHFTIYGLPRETPEDSLTEGLDLSPTIRLNFVVKLSSGDKAEEDILRGTVSWLHAYPDNCALLYYGEKVLFVRKEGKISINSNTDFWKPSFLEILDLPYSKLPFDIL